MRCAAIVAPLRMPIDCFGGSLRPLPMEELGSIVIKTLIERTYRF